jgi:hypothetical protein
MAVGALNYTPSFTCRNFMLSEHRMRALMGPVGGGKTTAAIVELLRQAIAMTPAADGIRRSRMLIVRNTKQQLKDTTLASVMELLPIEIYKWREQDYIMRFKFLDVESDWLFRSLDAPEDVQRVLSLQVSWTWVEEAREIPVQLLSDLEGRTGRYPSQAEGFRYRSGIIYTTNPPEIDSDHYKLLEKLPQEDDNENSIIDVDVFKQPSGLSPEAENKENLRPGYYEQLAKGKRKDWCDVYVHGRYAKSMAGKPVYETSFQYDRRVKANLRIDPNLPIIVGVDGARNPAMVFMQVGHDGKLRKLREAAGFDMGMKTFIQQKADPIINAWFRTNPLVFVGDPSFVRRGDGDDNSTYKELKNHYVTKRPGSGNKVRAAKTNDPVSRINALDEPFRNWWPDGEPGIEYDVQCIMCTTGLRSKYRYVRIKGTGGAYKDSPEKNRWAHTVEADQYGTLFALGKEYSATDYVRTKERRRSPQARAADGYVGY